MRVRCEFLAPFWRERATGITRVEVCRRSEKTTLFSRADTHVLSRSLGSRDERALRAPLKATPDSKPRPFPATLAPEPLLLPRSPFSLDISLSIFLSLSPASHFMSVFLFLSSLLRSSISLRILSQLCLALLFIFALYLPPSIF